MESALTHILMAGALATVLYCVGLALGLAPETMLETARRYAWVLVVFPVSWLTLRWVRRLQGQSRFQPGDHVIYLKQKFSKNPGPRAEQVDGAPRGEGFTYVVRKPWTVVKTPDEKTVEVVTNGGKHHLLDAEDPNLHHAGLAETLAMRIRWRKRFPAVDGQ
ncbi:MAG: hypothetical protein ACLFUJ_16090 [Phycisphaerae bacterium]